MRRNRFGRCSFVVLLVASVAACAGTTTGERDRSYEYRAGDDYVALDSVEPGAPINTHPFKIAAEDLRRLLERLRVKGADTFGTEPVFSKEELDVIAQPLASALSRAGPDQDVTFAVTSHRGLLGTYSSKSFTTGRMFVNADGLNLIFGLVQQRLGSAENDPSAVRSTVVPGSRARRIESTIWKIEPGGARLRGERADWLVFDRSALAASKGVPVPAAQGAEPAASSAAEPAPRKNSKADAIENRLQVLEELRKRGAITEEEYRNRRRAILDQL